VAEVALAQAAFGGLLGYFLGKAKLEQEPMWWLPLGLTLTAVLNGLFNLLRGQLDAGGIGKGLAEGLPSITGLALSGGLAVIVAGLVYALINRDITRSLAGQHAASNVDPAEGDRMASVTTIGTVIVLLLVGVFAWNNAVNRTTAFDSNGFRGEYPAYFSNATGEGEVLRVSDTTGTTAEFLITARPANGANAEGVASELGGERGTDFDVYKVQDRALATVNGKVALTQRFTAVASGSLTGASPELREGLDYIFLTGDNAVVVTLIASPDELAEVEPLFARFLNGLTLP
jgi:hypothetical protein